MMCFGFTGCRETLPHFQRLAVYCGDALHRSREGTALVVGAIEQVAETADAIPAIAVRLEHDRVAAAPVGARCAPSRAALQQLAARPVAEVQLDLDRLAGEVVHRDARCCCASRSAAPSTGLCPVSSISNVAPADLGRLLAHADHPLGPVEQRARIASLHRPR